MIQFAIWYALMTVVFSMLQYIENRREDTTYHTPVWWIAITWPYWLAYGLIQIARGKWL